MDIAVKQWKQALQYELQGEDYQSLVYTSHEGIPILPFYTAENVKESFGVGVKTQVMIPLFVRDKELTLARISLWEGFSVGNFLLVIQQDTTQAEVLQWLPKEANYIFATNLVDVTAYQNAGATIVQQIAFAIAQIKENISALQGGDIAIKVAVGGSLLLEIAKLRAFRRLLSECFPQHNIQLIAEVSNRGLSLQKGDYNRNYVHLAYEGAVLGGVDYLLPKNPLFFKKSHLNIEKENVGVINKLLNNRQSALLNGACAIEALSYEIYRKSSELLEQVMKAGGFTMLLNSNKLQRQIKQKADEEQAIFDKQCDALLAGTTLTFYGRKEWDFYPFSKRQTEKAVIMPLVAKRLWEKIEKQYGQKDDTNSRTSTL